MSGWDWLLVSFGVLLALWAGFVVWLLAIGRRDEARALATFVPDCVVLVSRLARDSRVPRRHKLRSRDSSTTRSSSRSCSAIPSGQAMSR